MGRAPCCEKMGLKKGPWTPEEDNILVTYIQQSGHGNWRALPKLAGLLRCGKSCRLRWTNYLRPDIKRGNFSREEEDDIINLHQMLGNRWSAIAARLPGRTDNEIKNVWHTHLKKRLKQTATATATAKTGQDLKPFNASSYSEESEVLDCGPVSPPQCTSSDTSSATTSGGSISNTDVASMKLDDFEASLPVADECFWSEVLSAENPDQMVNVFPAIDGSGPEVNVDHINEFSLDSLDMYVDNNVDFWFNIFPGAEEIPELLQIPEL